MNLAEKPEFKMELAEIAPRMSEFRRVMRVLFSSKITFISTVVIFILIITATLAPLMAPYDPYKQNLKKALHHPDKEHLLGTDPLGRDVLSRIIYGTRVSLEVGIIAVGIAATIGIVLGLIAGYFGSWLNIIIMRFVDALMTLPPLILAIALASVLGGGLENVMLSLGIALVPVYARLMCGQVLTVKETDYVLAARVLGASNVRVMFLHILPNCFPSLIVVVTLQVGFAVLAEAGLSFLGLGIAPPGAAWGAMVSEGYRYLLDYPLLSFAPGLCVMLVVLSFNIVGDGLRDALDPRLRGTL
jgi:peptide/nickel transport system permease protein